MKIFPNPADLKECITISFDEGLFGMISIELFDKSNTCVYSASFKKVTNLMQHLMYLDHLDRGSYILKVSNAGKTGSQKLILY